MNPPGPQPPGGGFRLLIPGKDPAAAFTGERFLPGLGGEIELEHLHRYLLAVPLCAGKEVLDIASGEGYGSALLAQVARVVVGVDRDGTAIEAARKRYLADNLRFEEGPCEHIPLPDGSVDVVVSFETIEHIVEHEAFLKEVRRVLREEGVLVISTPNKEEYNLQNPAPNPYHLRELQRAEFVALLGEHFPRVRLFSQRVLFASSVVTDDEAPEALPLAILTQDDDRQVTFATRLPRGPYLIAVCARDAGVPLSNSLFEGTIKINHFSSLWGGVRERDQRIVELTRLAAEREQHCAELGAACGERDGQVQCLRDRLGQCESEGRRLKAELGTYDEHVNQLERQLVGRDESISRLEKQLVGRDENISRLERQLVGRDDSIHRLEGQLVGRDHHLQWLERQLADRDASLRWLEGQVASREEQVRQIAGQLAGAHGMLQAVFRSRSWRVTAPLRLASRIVSRLLSWRWWAHRLLPRIKKRLRYFFPGPRRQARLLRATGLFDRAYYLRHSPDLNPRFTDPALHYVLAGAAEGRDPHPLFDTSWYIERNPYVLAAGINPLLHYWLVGAAEGRDPHPLFDSSFYMERNPDVTATGTNPLLHYWEHGAAEGRDPHPLFDTSFYLERNPDVAAAGINPLLHCWLVGAAEGRDPHPLFDTSFYLERNPDVVAAGVNPLVHYATHGAAEGRDPHPLFDSSFYLERNPDVAAASVNPLAHYCLAGLAEGRDPHPLFDTSFYLERNPDVAAAKVNPLAHYVTHGAAEGRDPHPLFDTSFYLERNPDVVNAKLNPLAHYWLGGGLERRDPHPLFHAPYYLAENPDCAASSLAPLHHYLVHGRAPQARKVHPQQFDAAFYLQCNPDVPPDETPLGHFITRHESPSPRGLSDAQLREWVERLNRSGPGATTTMSETPEVSIIIPDFNGIAYTLGCLQSLLAQKTRYRFEVIVVDDCSTDSTPRLLPTIGHIRYVRNSINSGFIRTCNHGAAQARGQYLVFLNNDVQVIGPWLDELIDTFTHVPQAGLVGSKLIYPTGVLQEAGAIIWNDGSGWNYGRNDDRHKPEYNYLREVDYCSGASIAIPRELWECLGGFDEHYLPAYAEDCDLAFRVREAGYKVLYQPLSEVVHYEGITHGRDETAGVKAYQVVNVRKLYERWQQRMRAHGKPCVNVERERDRKAVGRVLLVDHITPTPDQDAGSVLTKGVIDALQALGYKVTFCPDNLAFTPRYTADLQRVGVECRHAPHDPSISDHLRQHGHLYDAVILLRAPVASKHLDAIAQYAPRAKVIFHTTDLHYLREQRQAKVENKAEVACQAERTKKIELATALRSDCTIVVSEFEKEVLAAELPQANVYCFPLTLDVKGCATPFAERQGLMYLGGFNHPPNVDAVLYFLADLFPLIKAELPEVKLYVVGSHPPKAIRDLAGADVIVTGLVPDLGPYLDRVRLSVVPLRYGAGIKGKVLTSLSYGVPCVATPVAVEGMGLTDREEVLVAGGPAEFAAAVVRLYRDLVLWEALSRRGLAFVEANYSARRGQQHVRQILASVGLRPKASPRGEGYLKLVA